MKMEKNNNFLYFTEIKNKQKRAHPVANSAGVDPLFLLDLLLSDETVEYTMVQLQTEVPKVEADGMIERGEAKIEDIEIHSEWDAMSLSRIAGIRLADLKKKKIK